MNLADKINVVTGEPDAAEEILGLTAEEANLLADPAETELSAEQLAVLGPEAVPEVLEFIDMRNPHSVQSERIADIPAIDRQVDSVTPAKPIDVLVLTSHIKNPG